MIQRLAADDVEQAPQGVSLFVVLLCGVACLGVGLLAGVWVSYRPPGEEVKRLQQELAVAQSKQQETLTPMVAEPTEPQGNISIADDREPQTIEEIAAFERGLSRIPSSKHPYLFRALGESISQLKSDGFGLTVQERSNSGSVAMATTDESLFVLLHPSKEGVGKVDLVWDPERCSKQKFISVVGFFMPNIRIHEVERIFIAGRVVIESIEGPAAFPQSRISIIKDTAQFRTATIEPIR